MCETSVCYATREVLATYGEHKAKAGVHLGLVPKSISDGYYTPESCVLLHIGLPGCVNDYGYLCVRPCLCGRLEFCFLPAAGDQALNILWRKDSVFWGTVTEML